MNLAVTTWTALHEPVGRRVTRSWPQLVVGLTACSERQHDGRGWSPGTFRDERRRLANVQAMYAVGLDLDGGSCSVSAAADIWAGHGVFIHSTKSHTIERPRIRIILPLTETVDGDGYRRIWHWAANRMRTAGHEVDRGAADPSRYWYLPSLPNSGGRPEVIARWGDGLVRVDAAAILSVAHPVAAARPPVLMPDHRGRYVAAALQSAADAVLRASPGERHHALTREAYTLARGDLGLSPVKIRDTLLPAFVAVAGERRRSEGVRTIRDAIRARRAAA